MGQSHNISIWGGVSLLLTIGVESDSRETSVVWVSESILSWASDSILALGALIH